MRNNKRIFPNQVTGKKCLTFFTARRAKARLKRAWRKLRIRRNLERI